MVPVGVVGDVENGPRSGMRVMVMEDSAATGGFIIYQWWPGSEGPNADGAFDDWVESRPALEQYWQEAGWRVQWHSGPSGP